MDRWSRIVGRCRRPVSLAAITERRRIRENFRTPLRLYVEALGAYQPCSMVTVCMSIAAAAASALPPSGSWGGDVMVAAVTSSLVQASFQNQNRSKCSCFTIAPACRRRSSVIAFHWRGDLSPSMLSAQRPWLGGMPMHAVKDDLRPALVSCN